MKQFRNILLLLLCALPFALELPYCFHAMRSAPPEHWNWCFLLASVLLFLAAIPEIFKHRRENKDQAPPCNSPLRFLLLLPPALLLAVGYLQHIHFLLLIGGILLVFALICILYGWGLAAYLIPGMGMLFLFLPNVGMLLATVIPLDSILLKVLASLIPLALAVLFHFVKPSGISPSALLFWLLAGIIALCYLLPGSDSILNPPLLPDFTPLISRDFRGIADTVTE